MARISIKRLLLPSPQLIRLTAYLTCVSLVVAALAARKLYAASKEAGNALGHQLAGLSDYTERAETVLLNGARLHHSVASTNEPVQAVLDRVQAHCSESPGTLASALADVAQQHPKMLEQRKMPEMFRLGMIRDGNADHGMIVCFVGERRIAMRELTDQLKQFAKTADLSTFGYVRYVYAEKRQDGRTRVVTLWSDDSLKLNEMFPGTGDATGADSQVFPRPPESRRILSAAAEGMSFGLRTYESHRSPEFMRAFYDGWMKEHGFAAVAHTAHGDTHAYQRGDGAQVFVSLSDEKGLTYVTVTEAARTAGGQIVTVETRLE